MISIFPTRTSQKCLLVSSDQRNRTEARREISQWAAERNLPLPRNPRRLALLEDNRVVTEWIVIEQQDQPEPTPPAQTVRNGRRLSLVPGGQAA